MPKVMPAGSSIHYMGTVRMGATDDGTSVCDSYSRVWGVPGLVPVSYTHLTLPTICSV